MSLRHPVEGYRQAVAEWHERQEHSTLPASAPDFHPAVARTVTVLAAAGILFPAADSLFNNSGVTDSLFGSNPANYKAGKGGESSSICKTGVGKITLGGSEVTININRLNDC